MVSGVISDCRALLVDDDPFTRTVLSSTLRELGVMRVVAVGTSVAAMKVMNEESCDLAILDLDLGEGPTGIDVAHGLRRINPNLAVIVLSTYAEPRLLGRRQLELPVGVRFVVKQSITETMSLASAIDEVVNNPLRPAEVKESPAGVSGLSDLQIEIVRLISEGKSNGEIARLVVMEEGSVEKAIARIIKKLGVKADRTQNQRVMLAQFYFQLTKATHDIRD
jgi:DNA-binding NarL/FixJ family response regulator